LVFGGIAVGLAKKAISAQKGIEIDLSKVPTDGKLPTDHLLYSETQSRFIVTINPANRAEFEKHFANHKFAEIGKIIEGPSLIIKNGSDTISNSSLSDLEEAYKSTFKDF